MHIRKLKFFAVFLAFWITATNFAVEAQTTPANVREFKLNSKLLAREISYRIVVPEGYDADANKTKRYSVIYLLHGLGGSYENWTTRSKLAEHALKYQYIIVTPEGKNGWYTDSASVPNDKYESYIIQELIPEVDAKYRTLASRENRAIAGLSMGGYGALKFGLKYPDKFVLAGSFSGALGAAGWTSKLFEAGNIRGAIPDSLKAVYGADDSPTRAENDIFKMIRETSPEKAKTLPFIYLDCGTEDLLVIQTNREFGNLLFEKKITHEFRLLPGGHDWRFWNTSIDEFLEVSQKYIK